jgi:hypothetical protein
MISDPIFLQEFPGLHYSRVSRISSQKARPAPVLPENQKNKSVPFPVSDFPEFIDPIYCYPIALEEKIQV